MNTLLRYIIFGCLLMCLISSNAWAQPLNESTPEFKLKQAAEKLELNDYHNALELYEAYYEEDKENLDVAFIIGKLEYKIRDYDDAERTFRSLIRRVDRLKSRKERDPDTEVPNFPDLRLYYARCLKHNEDYEDAIGQYEVYINEEAEVPEVAAQAKIELEGAKMALKAPESLPEDVTINNLDDVNCKSVDIAPALHPNGEELYFASLNTDDIITLDDEQEDGEDKDPFVKIYRATQGGKSWQRGEALPVEVNRQEFHNADVSFSRDGNLMFFARVLLKGEEVEKSRIYFSKRLDEGWGPAYEVKGVNGDYLAKQPMPGELYGQEVLFFVSDMDGGKGGLDIYYATLVGEGAYKNPVNLGEVINTPADEETPFYQDGILYYSSEGFPGFGGLDIYRSEWNGTSWSKPRNMGKGINSSVHDKFFNLSEDGWSAVFASNREGGRSIRSKTCCFDIWEYKRKRIDVDAEITVFEAAKKEALQGATVQLVDVTGDFRVEKPKSKTNKEANDFQFTLKLDRAYQVLVFKDGFLPDTAAINTTNVTVSKTFKLPVYLEAEPPEFDTVTYTIDEPIRMSNIYYNFNDAQVLPEAEGDLEDLLEILNQYPEMIIELSSHTDARGDDAYNLNLSQRRADNARKWLMERGIDGDRIVPKGYGETQILNKCTNGVECTDEEHKLNRRTEFKIIEGPTSIQVKKKRVERVGGKGDTGMSEEKKKARE